MTLDEIKAAREAGATAEQTIEALTALIEADPKNADEPLTERGLLYWKMGRRADAINDYNRALTLNPQSRAAQAKAAAYAILDYYCKDFYNP